MKIGMGIIKACCLSLILFSVRSQYVTKEAVEGFGDFNVGQVIYTVIFADDPVLLANEETVIQGMIDRVIEIGGYYGTQMKVEIPHENLKAAIPSTDYERSKTTEECGVFPQSG